MTKDKKERVNTHGRFEAAEALLDGGKSLEELLEYRELMLEHLHRLENNPEFGAESSVIVGFRLLVEAIEARIRLKEFLLSQER
jgi:hypothetical protein